MEKGISIFCAKLRFAPNRGSKVRFDVWACQTFFAISDPEGSCKGQEGLHKVPLEGATGACLPSSRNWVLPEDYCKKDPCNLNTEMFVSEIGNPCPTLDQLLASRILYALLVGEKQHKIAMARFCTQSCSEVGQLLVNSSPTPHLMEVAGVFLAIVLWQHPKKTREKAFLCRKPLIFSNPHFLS